MKRHYLINGLALSVLLGVWGLSPCRVGVVMGHSMDPTLHSGQLIAIERNYYQTHAPRPGEIVVFRHGGMTYVKRVYAAQGETIFLLADGEPGARTFIQPVRRAQVERVRAAMRRHSQLTVRRLRIPAGCFYALGDSLNNSIDSRELGPIGNEELIGRVQPFFGAPPPPDLEVAIPHVRPHPCRAPHRSAASA
jgi:signal peptidase I